MKVTIAGRELTSGPVNLRMLRRLMEAGILDKLQRFSDLPQHEQMTVMVGYLAAAFRVEDDWFWDEVGADEFARLPEVFGVVSAEATKEKGQPAGEAPSP